MCVVYKVSAVMKLLPINKLSSRNYNHSQLSKINKQQMEEDCAAKDKEIATVPSKVKVLAIGDEHESSTSKRSAAKHEQDNFRPDFRKHLSLLLMGAKTPIDFTDDWSLYKQFEAISIQNGNQPRRYQFLCSSYNTYSNGAIVSGHPFNAQSVLCKIKKRLSEENWISENMVEAPFKAKAHPHYYNSDQYIQGVVSDVLDAEMIRLFQFLYYLHKENAKNKNK